MKQINVNKSNVYFKMRLINVLDKYPMLKRSSLSLNFFEDNLKTIKEICKDSENEFK